MAVTTDPDKIRPLLMTLLRRDPVRNTVLGTVWASLGEATEQPWAAVAGASSRLAVRSQRHYPVALSTGWEADHLAELAPLLRTVPGLSSISGNAAAVETLVRALGRDVSYKGEQRLFRLDELVPPSGVAGRGVRADVGHRELLIAWVRAFLTETHVAVREDSRRLVDEALADDGVWLWIVGGRPVSTAFRRPAVAGSARIGPVYTPQELRGNGYASAATAAATRHVLSEAAVPVLFTELANPTSNKIYLALGYYPVEDRAYVRFRG